MAGPRPNRPDRRNAGRRETDDDTLRRRLSREERARLAIDSWEPSLLRYLLYAEGRLNCDGDGDGDG